ERLSEVERHMDLLDKAFDTRQAVAAFARHDTQNVLQLPVREVRLVAAKVEVDASRTGDGPADPVLQHLLASQHPDTEGTSAEDLRAEYEAFDLRQPSTYVGNGFVRASGPPGR